MHDNDRRQVITQCLCGGSRGKACELANLSHSSDRTACANSADENVYFAFRLSPNLRSSGFSMSYEPTIDRYIDKSDTDAAVEP